ncbi:unnamed protein product [Ectocarpus sp. 12 AP-2014]
MTIKEQNEIPPASSKYLLEHNKKIGSWVSLNVLVALRVCGWIVVFSCSGSLLERPPEFSWCQLVVCTLLFAVRSADNACSTLCALPKLELQQCCGGVPCTLFVDFFRSIFTYAGYK